MDLFVARQAILDERLRTYGYELLFRSGFTTCFDGTDGAAATVNVITNTFLSMGAQSILGGRRGFINFPRQMIVDGSWRVLPKRSVVIEVLETVEPDDAVIAACREMKQSGYRFALDDFVLKPENERFLELADYVKVDVQATHPAECRSVARDLSRRGIRLVAEKVESRAEFEAARKMGFKLFQGFFFTHPVVVTGRDVPGTKINYVRILHEVQRGELRLDRLEALLRHELSVTHKLLRYVNSAAFGWRDPIKTIREAMMALGELQMRRWLMLAVLPGLALDSPNELVAASLVRARLCERLAAKTGAGQRQQELFMMGLFSLLDSILNRPLESLLTELKLSGDTREALLGTHPDSYCSYVYSLACACETADWAGIQKWAAALGLDLEILGPLLAESLSWSDQMIGDLVAQ